MGNSGSRIGRSLPAWTSSAVVAVLVLVLTRTGRLGGAEAIWLVASVLVAYLPTGWAAPVGWHRRAAEAALIPVVCVLVLVPDPTSRRMLLPPLLATAAGAALLAAMSTAPRDRWPKLIGFFGLALRAAGGLGLVGQGGLAVAATLVVSGLLPWSTAFLSRRAGVATALVLAVLPLQRWPWTAVVLAALAIWLVPWGRASRLRIGPPMGWMPAIVAASLLGLAVAPWAGVPLGFAFPALGLTTVLAVLIAMAVTFRFPPAAAGIVWFLVAVAVGPTVGPSPEGRAFQLTPENPVAVLPESNDWPYELVLSVQGGGQLESGFSVAAVNTGGVERSLRIGRETAESMHAQAAHAVRHRQRLPDQWLLRPSRIGADGRWRVIGRTKLAVDPRNRPTLMRDPRLPDEVRLVVEAAGPSKPTPPRDWRLPSWVWAAAIAVVLMQVMSRTWSLPLAALPWCLLTIGQLLARFPVEPLRLLSERYAVDLSLAAVLAAWLPAAWVWLAERRVFRTVAALLVPLALATPHLTPSMYGDEPFHLFVMQSVVEDGDLELMNNLDVEARPNDRTYLMGDPLLHSPVLAFALLPGYLVAGRSGALLLLALAGAGLVALIARRSQQLGLDGRRWRLLVMLLAVSYPLATFATQIWVELPGALIVAAILVLPASAPGGRWAAAGFALIATAMKTRLALLSFPPAAMLWWRGGRGSRWGGLSALAVAAGSGLAVGWITMGHPFGYFRRLHHLLPTSPELAARVVGGLAFDVAGGLAFTAPLMLVSVAGLGLLWRRGGPGERAVVIGGAVTVAALLHSPEWYGGGSPPGRYLVPLLPVFALSLAQLMRTPRRWRRLGELLLAPSLFMWWTLVTRPHFSINPGDGGWWLSDALGRSFLADTQQFFPSFLIPTTATYWFPPAVVALILAIGWLVRRRPGALQIVLRIGLAVWFALVVLLTIAVTLRCDRVVEAEAPQVRLHGGRPVPQAGTFSRYTRRNGWMLADSQGVTFPLKLPANSKLWLEGWLLGPARRGARLDVRWDEGPAVAVEVRGEATEGRVRMPDPPGPGRHRLHVTLRSPPQGKAVLDRIVIER